MSEEYREERMAAAHGIVLVIIVVGGLTVTACAPPTPKVGSPIIPQVMEREHPCP